MLEAVRPEIQQYFVESETSGMPIAREYRSLIYQWAKGDRDTRPYGTIFDVNRSEYKWVNHSLAPKQANELHPRVGFGGRECTHPYRASPLNISTMSYGALSKNAIMALNKGAKPVHEGILPAAKLTEEIARIRHVPMGRDVVSPAAHAAFSTPSELLGFVAQLRELSGGKPTCFNAEYLILPK